MQCKGFIVFLLVSTLFISCNKDSDAAEAVEFYLLRNFSIVPGKCQVDPSSATLESTPLILNDEIIEYSKSTHEFRLTGIALQKIKVLNDKAAFAVTVDRNVIYYGFFKPSISSSSCEHSITMDITSATNQTIGLQLGYPGGMFPGIDDQRNNATLMATLNKQGKLK